MHIENNVLESILNTLLMNDISKDTTKARQDLKRLGIRSGLWLGQNKNGKCTKPQAAYSFTPGDIKKFCQFIKGVKLPDGFRSNFKHKVTDNDTNITGLKSHDYVVKPIIELCLFFKQICSQTLMEDAMLKAQSMVVDILCNLELIYPLGFFDIMIHLVIHLPLDTLKDDPIRPRWMYPFERFMKKLKNHIRNKAKPEGSITEGYVAEEALTFSSHYFWDVTMKFNRFNRNVDFPPLTDDPDIIHVDNSFDLALTTSLNDLEYVDLHIDGQSIDVDAPPDIIDVDEDDDIIDDEDVLPHDLADSDDEDLVNVDDDDGVAMSADVARGHGGDGGGDDRPPPHQLAGGCRGKGTRKPNLGGRKAGRMHTRKETRNLGLRKITDELGPQPIRFKWKDNGMMLPLGDHSSHWANLLGKIVKEFLMHFGSWRSILAEWKAGILGKIRTQFDLKPHMQSELWPEIRKGIDQHLGKIYTDNKSSLKKDYWVKNPDDETYDVEAIRSRHLANISAKDWDAQIRFWSDPKNMARCAQNARNWAKSTIICRQGSWSLPSLRDKHMQSSATQEYPSLIQTFFDTHTVGGVFLRDEDRRLYEEMQRLQALGEYIDDQIMVMVRKGKHRGHIPSVGRGLAGRGKDVINVPEPRCKHTSDVDEIKRTNKQLKKQMDMIMKVVGSDDKMSQLLT
ncbi:F-box domain containing protein [Tanacetum coccineum]